MCHQSSSYRSFGNVEQDTPNYPHPETDMDVKLENPVQEIKGLQRCINDLVSVLALPAIWIGGGPSQIVRTVLDVLPNMLQLDLIYLGFEDPSGGAPLEAVHAARLGGFDPDRQKIAGILKQTLGADPCKWTAVVRHKVGDEELSLLPIQLGLQGEIGVILAGSRRLDFPQQSERLLLGVAANQVAIGLQEARLLSEQTRVANELDRRVLQRTSELAASNEELKRSEARKTAILDSALDCIVTIDHEARITEFNPAAERTFGHRREDVVGRQLADVIIPEPLRERHRQGFSRYLSTGEAHVLGKRLELTARRADGSEFPVELAITRIPIGGPPSFTGYLRDITERKQSEEKLRSSEAYLAEAQRLSHTGSFGWKLSSGEITWSEETFRIFECDPTAKPNIELVLKRVHPEDIALVSRSIEHASQHRKDWELEHRLLMPDGVVKHVHVVAHAVGGPSEKFEFVGAVMDVSERRQSEEALRKARTNLAHVARLTTVGELTASIAHEVNQPLAAVVTNANASLRWLDHEPPNFEEVRIAVQRIIRDGNRGSDVIKRIRGLVKKEHSSRARLDVNQVIRETIALAGLDLQGTVVRTELAGELPQVQADRVQLQQVLLNLAINAMDAMKPVTDRPHLLRIQTKCNEGRTVQVVVEDSGVGLSSEGMERLFETFYTTKPEGLGMGLSICRSIIEGHGGRLWAESTEGAGTRFQFTLPIERGSPL